MLRRLKARGLRICVWINPYIAQRSALFDEGMQQRLPAQAARRRCLAVGSVAGRAWALVDFTNPDACRWFGDKLRALLDMGVDCFKTDFGERIPTDVVYFDGSDPVKMHNYYAYLYNKTVFEVLEEKRGAGRGDGVRALGHRRRPAVPGSLGRRLHRHIRVDGREPARRAVAGPVGVWLLEPRHRRLRADRIGRCVQALVRVRPAVVAQPAARQQLVPRALAVRRGGRRCAARLHQAQVPADALPVRRGHARRTRPACR